jgi:ABC-type multidrug transport system fused ATPase/permease subunit
MKGLRGLVVLAMIITVLQVSCDICAAFPLKFIPSKVQNVGNDPACLFPFLDPIESWFDIPQLDQSLQPDPNLPPNPPPEAQCPINPNDAHAQIVLVSHSTIGVIVFSVLMLVIFGLLSALLAFADLYLAVYIGQQLTARLRNQLFDHLQRLSLDWHGKQQKGDLVQRVTGNVADIEKLVTDGLVDLLAGVLTLVGVVSVMLFLSPQYTLISLAIAPTLLIMVLGFTRSIKAATKKAAKATGQIGYVATEDINALILIKVFTREAREARRFGSYVEKNKRARMRAGFLQAQFTPLVSLLVILGTAAVIGVGGYVAIGNNFNIGSLTIAANSVDVGTLILFLIFLKLLYQPMRDLSKLATLASTAASGAERIQEVMDRAPEVKVSPLLDPYSGPQRFQGEITFEHVEMGYLPGVPVLRGIDLQISPGKKIGLVGLSGGGKTTLAKLIPHFYDIQEGTIKIDGVDIRLYPLDVLRNNVSMVLQDSLLFEGNIAENIAIGRPGACIEDIVEAAKKAQIHETIMSLPDGYETHVSEQGENFSGGQRQRLAIARAILRDAPILILDEPTAALDVEAEVEVMRALDALVVGRTVIVISHRLSTLGNVDEILVMNRGVVAERGTFKELKSQHGLFAHLLAEQNRYNLDHDDDIDSLIHSILTVTSPRLASALSSATLPSIPVVSRLSETSSNGSTGPLTTMLVSLSQERNDAQAKRKKSNGHEKVAVKKDDLKQRPADIPIQARILVEVDSEIVGEYQLAKPIITFGRLPSSDIPISSQHVSRFHGIIRWNNGAWVIEDAESLNGLSCQGQHITQLALVEGDRIYIDPTIVLEYREKFAK